MRVRVFAVLFLAGAATVTLSLLRGQERPAQPPSPPQAAPAAPPAQTTPSERLRKQYKPNAFQTEILLSAQRGADWTYRMHGVKGRFLEGRLPSVAQDVEGDHYVRQLHAAIALARAARFTGEERFAARATQAMLVLLEDAPPDETDAACRCVSLPPVLVNRLGATGLLVVAINELPQPDKALLDKSEQLCNYLRKQARADGSLAYHDGKEETEGINEYPGAALYGLALSQRHRPAEWKAALLKKALPHYRECWKKNPAMAFVPLMSAAFAETHALTKDKACADFVFEMNDWLCGLQYLRVEPRKVSWHGGFHGWQNGQAVESMPTADDAVYAGSLAQACRCAREQGNQERFSRYSESAEHALRFLKTLQYTAETTGHYADWYRPRLLGGFHHSHTDGNLRIEQTSHAVAAMLACLEHAW
jgi:hypothetical protein